MLRSLRSKLIVASLLWTGGLLMMMHLFFLLVVHMFPSVRGARSLVPIVIALCLMAAGLLLGFRQGLEPFRQLRKNLNSLRTGQASRVEGGYPSEVQPLVDDLNVLLENREKAVRRALATAGDLAHGLKTPLALLAQEAERASAAGSPELAENIAQQVERMSRQVNYHLARARAAASGPSAAVRCPVAGCTDGLVRTLLKLYAGKALQISSTISPDLAARVQQEDLAEMLGNLLDNACKWANSRVLVSAERDGLMLAIALDDDGPGLARELRTVVLERGVRVDEAAPGSGLGLAIVRDLAELYGGSIALDESQLGGLGVRLRLPAA